MLQLQHACRLTCVNAARKRRRSTTSMSQRLGRRILASAAIVGGALLLWLSPEAVLGLAMVIAGVALEAIGIRLEHLS
jgi:cytochrome c-type biogenesis protein CcmH/NrfF